MRLVGGRWEEKGGKGEVGGRKVGGGGGEALYHPTSPHPTQPAANKPLCFGEEIEDFVCSFGDIFTVTLVQS